MDWEGDAIWMHFYCIAFLLLFLIQGEETHHDKNPGFLSLLAFSLSVESDFVTYLGFTKIRFGIS